MNRHSIIGLLAVAVIALLVGIWVGAEKENILVELSGKIPGPTIENVVVVEDVDTAAVVEEVVVEVTEETEA